MTKTIIYTMLLFTVLGTCYTIYSKFQKLENQLFMMTVDRDILQAELNQKVKEDIVRQEKEVLEKLKEQIEIKELEDKITHNNYKKELRCMAENLYHEARGESKAGQRAVAEVVMNRVESKRYPNTICGVIHQRSQFSWTLDKKNLNKKLTEKNKLYKKAKKIAIKVMLNNSRKLKATHYHTHAVSPYWNKNMKQVAMIGEHRFFVGG